MSRYTHSIQSRQTISLLLGLLVYMIRLISHLWSCQTSLFNV